MRLGLGLGCMMGLLVAAVACSHGAPAASRPLVRRVEALSHRTMELYEAGRYPEAVSLAEDLLANQMQLFGPDDEGTAHCLNALGTFLRLSGRPREAIPRHEEALIIFLRRSGLRDLHTARTLDMLGTARLLTGDLAGADANLVASLEIVRSLRGPKSLEIAHNFNSVGYLRRVQDRFAEARQLFERSLAIYRLRHKEDNPDALAVLRNLAGLAVEEGDLPAARNDFERALATSLRILGKEHPDTARVQGDLADVLLELRDLAGAEASYRQALSTADKVLGAGHPDRARYLGGLGEVAKSRRDSARAREYFAVALAIYEKAYGEEHPDTATAAANLGTALGLLGRDEEAVACYERALVIDRKVFGDHSLQVATTLDNLGIARERLGELAEALRLQEEALAIRKEKLGPRHPEVARSLTNLGGILHALGHLATAQGLHEEALSIRLEKLGPKHPRTAASWNNLGALCEDRGDLICAQDLYERALAIWEESEGKDHPDIAVALNNLGMVAIALGDPERALLLLMRALAIWEKAYGANHPAVATALENLGSLFRFVDAPESEWLYLERAFAMRVRTLGEKHPDVAQSHHNLGAHLRRHGRLTESRHHLEQAVALREELLGGDHPDTATSLRELAATEVVAGHLDRALDLAERAAAIDDRWIREILQLGSDEARRLFLRKVTGGADWAVTLHLRDNPTNPRAARLALTAILRTQGRALDASVVGRRRLRRQLGPEEQALLTRQAELRQEQVALLLRPRTGGDPARTRHRSGKLAAEIRQIEAELSRRSAAAGGEIPAIDLEAIQKQIPAEAALIEFFVFQPWDAEARGNPWGKPRYAAYVVRSTGAPAAVDLGDAAVLDRAAKTFRQALAQPAGSDARAVGRALDLLTMEKVRPLLGDARTLLLVPDQDLNLIPFAALVDEGSQFLVERYLISYLASGRDLLPGGEQTCDSQEPPLVVGGPDFGGPAEIGAIPGDGDPFPAAVASLPGAAAEAEAVGSLLDLAKERILTGPLAGEAAVKAARGPRFLHLATHGFFLPDLLGEEILAANGDRLPARARETRAEVFLRSGVALAGYNRRQHAHGPDDGLLTALEVMDLDLCGTELVTLSACETGLGEARGGQGVFGLRRALALAGAHSQLLTLWKVADGATKDLMVSFYAQVRQGVPFAEALRWTQLAALRQESLPADIPPRGVRLPGRPDPGSTAALAHPYYWASFILSGRTERAIESTTHVPR